MKTPNDDGAFLHELEIEVRTELTVAETGEPEYEAVVAETSQSVPVHEVDGGPDAKSELELLDEQRYETSLRSLLGAIEAVEDKLGPGD